VTETYWYLLRTSRSARLFFNICGPLRSEEKASLEDQEGGYCVVLSGLARIDRRDAYGLLVQAPPKTCDPSTIESAAKQSPLRLSGEGHQSRC
jgi:hypothetical protein